MTRKTGAATAATTSSASTSSTSSSGNWNDGIGIYTSGSEMGSIAPTCMNLPCAVRPDRVEILGVLAAGCAAARFFLLPTIAVGLEKISFERGKLIQ